MRARFISVFSPKIHFPNKFCTKFFEREIYKLAIGRREIGTYLIFDVPSNRKMIINLTAGNYEKITSKYTSHIDKNILDALSKMIIWYETGNYTEAIMLIDHLNSIRPDWIKYWPSNRTIIMFNTILEKNKLYSLIIHYYVQFERLGYKGSSACLQQVILAYLNQNKYLEALDVLELHRNMMIGSAFIPKFIQTIFKVFDLSEQLELFEIFLNKLGDRIDLRNSLVDNLIHNFRHLKCDTCLAQNDFRLSLQYQYVLKIIHLLKNSRYNLTMEQSSKISRWFKKNFSKDSISVNFVSRHLSPGLRRQCKFCHEKFIKFPLPKRGNIFKDALLDIVTNTRRIIESASLEIQKEFSSFEYFLQNNNYRTCLFVDYSNLRFRQNYSRSLSMCNPINQSLSNNYLWNEFSKYWDGIIQACPSSFKIACISPNFYTNELRFLFDHPQFTVFSPKYIKEDLLCIYGCARVYLHSLENQPHSSIIPMVVTNDIYQEFFYLSPKHNELLSRWLNGVCCRLVEKSGVYNLKPSKFDNNIHIYPDSIHFPVEENGYLCIRFL